MLTRRAAVGMLLLCPWADALAQPRYPDQPIKLIVPFPPGGPADIVGRLVGRALGDRLGQPFVVDNRSGAGGTIGMAVVAQAKPDGYTLGIGSTGALTILPHMMPRMPFDPQRDFQPISQVIAVPQVLTVHPSVPARTVAELVGLCEAATRQAQLRLFRPGQLASPDDRAVQVACGRHGHSSRALPRRGAGADRPGRRAGPDDVR